MGVPGVAGATFQSSCAVCASARPCPSMALIIPRNAFRQSSSSKPRERSRSRFRLDTCDLLLFLQRCVWDLSLGQLGGRPNREDCGKQQAQYKSCKDDVSRDRVHLGWFWRVRGSRGSNGLVPFGSSAPLRVGAPHDELMALAEGGVWFSSEQTALKPITAKTNSHDLDMKAHSCRLS
jgi:hypothetical protein